MITSEQKEELYRFLCKKINYGVHPINDIAQLLADNHISSRDFGYGRLKTMLRDIPEFLNLLPPETGSEEMRVRFSIWQPPKPPNQSKSSSQKRRRKQKPSCSPAKPAAPAPYPRDMPPQSQKPAPHRISPSRQSCRSRRG